MKNIKMGGRWYMSIEYYNYIANNLSEFGCVLFDNDEYVDFDFSELKSRLVAKHKALEKIYFFPINVYSFKEKKLHTYSTFVNNGRLSSFVFFDMVRMACNEFKLNRFYACDFASNEIYEMTQETIVKYGGLIDLRKLLNLGEDRYIVGKWMKWCGPPGYTRYYQAAKVFRNDAEKEFFEKYGKFYSQYSTIKLPTDIYYSFDECKDRFNETTNTLEFDKHTILEFDIDNPSIDIKATSLKARNLHINNISATKELFCEKLICNQVETKHLYAEGVECRKLKAEGIKTNFRYGVRFYIN